MGESVVSMERAAIASLLAGGWHHGGHVLTEQDFTESRYRRIFRAIRQLADDGQTIDQFSVEAKSGIDLKDFTSEFASPRSIGTYADTLQDLTLQRNLGNAARSILSSEGSGKERLLQAQSLLADLHSGAAGEVVPVADAVADWWQELDERTKSHTWLHTGYADVDKRLGGLRGGDLIILAGRPAMGKTALALNIAQQCGKPAAFFSLEMQRSSLLDRLAASLSGVSLGHIRSPKEMGAEEWERVTAASVQIRSLSLYIDDTPGLTIEEIHARSRSLKARHGLDLVVVDYLQMIEADPRLSREQQVSTISRHGKRMAKDLNVPVILLAQLSRKCEDRTDKRPLMSDLRDSGAIEQDADAVGFVYRDEVYDQNSPRKGYAELLWRKVRQGQTGTDWFIFQGAQQKFLPAVAPPEIKREAPAIRKPYAVKEHWSD